MTQVWFRCNRKNEKMFVLNSFKEIDYVPMVGDIIETYNDDFQKASFRVKPFRKQKGLLKNCVFLDFKVVSRRYSIKDNNWLLICEPTSDSLIYLLRNISVK